MELGCWRVEHDEHHQGIDGAVQFIGGMVNGLFSGPSSTLKPEDPDDDVSKLARIARRQGAAVLAATGVPPVA